MSTASQKAIVRRYLEEGFDKGNLDVLGEIVASDCLIHFPGAAEPIRGLAALRQTLDGIVHTYSEFRTTIHALIGEDDCVAARLTHRAVNRGEWTSRLGRHHVAGKPVTWMVMSIFRFREDKIVEEWVCRDELGMLIQVGVLTPPPQSE